MSAVRAILHSGVRTLSSGFINRRAATAYRGAMSISLFLVPFSMLFIVGGLLPSRFAWTASIVIILNGVATVLSELRAQPLRRTLGVFAALTASLFAVEYVGVTSGFPFGQYHYTDVLGLAVFGVPLAIPFAWYATVVNTWRISQGMLGGTRGDRPVAIAASAGILTVALDVALEPMASDVTRYWVWLAGSVPLQNYLSWFAFTMVAAALLERADARAPGARQGLLFHGVLVSGLQWALFILTDLVNGHLVPVIISVCLLVAAVAGIRLVHTLHSDEALER